MNVPTAVISQKPNVFVNHLFEAHGQEDSFKYVCDFSPCSRMFETGQAFNAFCSHCA